MSYGIISICTYRQQYLIILLCVPVRISSIIIILCLPVSKQYVIWQCLVLCHPIHLLLFVVVAITGRGKESTPCGVSSTRIFAHQPRSAHTQQQEVQTHVGVF